MSRSKLSDDAIRKRRSRARQRRGVRLFQIEVINPIDAAGTLNTVLRPLLSPAAWSALVRKGVVSEHFATDVVGAFQDISAYLEDLPLRS